MSWTKNQRRKCYNYWPRTKLKEWELAANIFVSTKTIEERLSKIYKYEVVLTGSGRNSILLILLLLKAKRGDNIYTNKYSSHCIISSIGLVANPIFSFKVDAEHAIAYRQWGYDYTYEALRKVVKGEIIEDIADTMFAENGFKFKEDQRFAICSLPKILSAINGGAIICRNKRDAHELRKLRKTENRVNATVNDALRLVGNKNSFYSSVWHGIACRASEVSNIARSNIYAHLKEYNAKYEERINNIEDLCKVKVERDENIECMPCCIPFQLKGKDRNKLHENYYAINRKIRLPIRMFNQSRDYTDENWIQVACIPIHTRLDKETIGDISEYACTSDLFSPSKIWIY